MVVVEIMGSVEDERVFSTLSFMKTKLRNKLTDHLDLTVRMFCQSHWRLDNFPFDDVFAAWKQVKDRVKCCRVWIVLLDRSAGRHNLTSSRSRKPELCSTLAAVVTTFLPQGKSKSPYSPCCFLQFAIFSTARLTFYLSSHTGYRVNKMLHCRIP